MTCAYNVEIGPLVKLLDERTEKLVGEVLTLLEAVIPGDRQLDASKKTIKQLIWGFNRDVKKGCDEMMNKVEEII